MTTEACERFRERLRQLPTERQWGALWEFIRAVMLASVGPVDAARIDVNGIADRLTLAASERAVELATQGRSSSEIGEDLIVFLGQRVVLELPFGDSSKAH